MAGWFQVAIHAATKRISLPKMLMKTIAKMVGPKTWNALPRTKKLVSKVVPACMATRMIAAPIEPRQTAGRGAGSSGR